MGGAGADLSPVESVTAIRRRIGRLAPGDNGKFLNYDGGVLPW